MELRVAGRKAFAGTGGAPFDPTKPLVVFVHGAGMDHTIWALQSRYFAHHGRAVLALDLPGHGHSEGPQPASIEPYVDWLAASIELSGAGRATLVGHSMGALVALETAARHPEKVTALALLGCAARMPVHPDLIAAADADDSFAIELMTAWGYGKPAHLGGHRAPGLWMLGGGKHLIARCAAGVLAKDLRACDAYGNAIGAASRIACPTLLVIGSVDRMTPPKGAEALAAAIKGAETVTLRGVGHMMMVEAPDETIAALRRILR